MNAGEKGFTLVEMLVAIGLMALMAVICWRGLAYVADQRATVAREAGEIAELVRTFAQMERDLAERVPNGALPAPGAPSALPLALGVSVIERGAEALEVTRFVPQPGAAPQAVSVLYRVSGDGLSRSTRRLDDARAAGNNEVVLLPGARTLRVRVHAGGFWVDPGHQGGVQPTAPATALEIAVEDRDGSRYTKVFAL